MKKAKKTISLGLAASLLAANHHSLFAKDNIIVEGDNAHPTYVHDAFGGHYQHPLTNRQELELLAEFSLLAGACAAGYAYHHKKGKYEEQLGRYDNTSDEQFQKLTSQYNDVKKTQYILLGTTIGAGVFSTYLFNRYIKRILPFGGKDKVTLDVTYENGKTKPLEISFSRSF